MVQYGICPGETLGLLTILLMFRTNICPLLVGRYAPTKAIRVHNKDKPRFDDQFRHACGLKQEAHLRWTRDRSRVNWKEFVHCQVRANETNLVAKRQFSERKRVVLLIV